MRSAAVVRIWRLKASCVVASILVSASIMASEVVWVTSWLVSMELVGSWLRSWVTRRWRKTSPSICCLGCRVGTSGVSAMMPMGVTASVGMWSSLGDDVQASGLGLTGDCRLTGRVPVPVGGLGCGLWVLRAGPVVAVAGPSACGVLPVRRRGACGRGRVGGGDGQGGVGYEPGQVAAQVGDDGAQGVAARVGGGVE